MGRGRGRGCFLLLLLFSCSLSLSLSAQSIWNPEHLSEVRRSLDHPFYASAYRQLLADADALLHAPLLSVMQKEKTAVSGDKHDYLSQARYFWPDPSKPDGRPYINRDGVSNPELERLDRVPLGRMAERVTTLSLAWYFSGEEKYAEAAARQLRAWFLDEATRMNPHLRYAQVVPGHNGDQGRCYGVLDAYSFVEMLDGVQLLESSDSFTSQDSAALKEWFGHLLDWMLESPQGKEESRQANNHSTAYDVQVVAFALYAGRTDVARSVVERFAERRIFTQIAPDGSQPHELTRTLAFGYSQYNLTHMIDLFCMASRLDTGFSGFSGPAASLVLSESVSPDGRSFYKAMDFLAAYLGKPLTEWPYQQISGWEEKQQEFCRDLYRTALLNPSRTDYLRLYRLHATESATSRFRLLYMEMKNEE